jgi:hypothetical protein
MQPRQRFIAAPLGWRRALAQAFAGATGSARLLLGEGFGDLRSRQRIERRLAFWRGVCGCQAAALAFVITGLSQAAAAHVWWPLDGWALARGLGVALAAALVAKLGALLLARLAAAAELRCLGCQRAAR